MRQVLHPSVPGGIRILLAGLFLAAGHARLAAQEEEIDLGEGESLEELTGEDAFPLQITGFGVAGYHYDGRTKENTFAGSKLAASLFRELSPQFWVFGQLTTFLEEADGGGGSGATAGDVTTTTEIDNLIVNFTPTDVPSLSVFLGKFDDPLGFERDDEPLNLQPTTTFNFELGRPTKLVGVGARWNFSPKVNLLAMVTNGWESQIDPNHGKTVGGRLGVLPTENSSLGVGGLFGPEGAQGETHDRYLLSVDYSWQPVPDLILAGEANLGGDKDGVAPGEDANWVGATVTVFRRLAPRVGITARGEVFDDKDGARTGVAQTLSSFSIAPAYFIGTGRNGIFSNVEHTTFRIPRFQVRGEVRLNHSTVDFFETGGAPDNWDIQYIFQIVTAL